MVWVSLAVIYRSEPSVEQASSVMLCHSGRIHDIRVDCNSGCVFLGASRQIPQRCSDPLSLLVAKTVMANVVLE